MQATDIYVQLATELTSQSDSRTLLGRLLEPIVRMTGARSGSAHLRCADSGVLRQEAAFAVCAAGPGPERTVVVPLTHRGRVLGEFQLNVPAQAVLADATVAVHRTLGALLGLALHDAGVERESRQALAADVHDGIAQTLAFARMRLPLLEEAIAVHDEPAALRFCADVRQAIGTAHTNLRAILTQCSAPMDPKGLKHALRSSARCFREQTQVELKIEDRAPDLRLSAAQEAQVYLIVQEALANIAKHAGADHAWLKIEQQDDRVDVVVEDDGAGLPATSHPTSPSHFGMDIMRQRAARLGGEIVIAVREGGGTRLRLAFPRCAAEGVNG
jgi:two-component system, NarL family, nitrate/nitrite sensor histidine kinase NarX